MDIQTSIQITPEKSCAFTGHRELDADLDKKKLKKELISLIENGVDTFYNGGAVGFDLLAGEIIIRLKKKYTQIKLILCIPCPEQDKYYSDADKKRYQKIYKKSDETIVLSETYTKYCMLARDRYMADKADVLFAYKRKETGGTAYTVRYFTKKYPYKRTVFI